MTYIINYINKKYMNNKFVLIINGPIDSGSRRVVEILMEKLKRVFLASANKIKFLISDYTPDKDRKIIHESILFLAEKMLQNDISLIVEGGSIEQENLNQKIKDLALKENIKIVTVNIESPVEVLRERFLKRLEKSVTSGQKASVFDEEGFMKRVNAYFGLKNPENTTFDSSVEAPESIAKKILALI